MRDRTLSNTRFLCQKPLQSHREKVSKAIAAALMTKAQLHPNACIPRELARLPITFRSLVNSTTITTKGGARSPFNIADQNSIFTALKPAKSKASPTTIATAITASGQRWSR